MKLRNLLILFSLLLTSVASADVIQFRASGVLTSVDSAGSNFPDAAAGDPFFLEYTIDLADPRNVSDRDRYSVAQVSLSVDGRTIEFLPGVLGTNAASVELIEYQRFSPDGIFYWDSFVMDAYASNGSGGLSFYLITDRSSTVESDALEGTRHPRDALDLSLFATNLMQYRSAAGDIFAGTFTSFAPVPLPAAAWLLASTLLPLSRARRRRTILERAN